VLVVVGLGHLLFGVPAMLAPGVVHGRLPERYADAVGDPDEWRQFGTALTIVGLAAVGIASLVG
jgi:hypothetical protein